MITARDLEYHTPPDAGHTWAETYFFPIALPEEHLLVTVYVVVRDAKVLLDAQRAWFLPQGIEPDPDAIPPLDVALRIRKPAASPGGPNGPLAPVGGSDRRERGGTIDTPPNEEAGPGSPPRISSTTRRPTRATPGPRPTSSRSPCPRSTCW